MGAVRRSGLGVSEKNAVAGRAASARTRRAAVRGTHRTAIAPRHPADRRGVRRRYEALVGPKPKAAARWLAGVARRARSR
jgi:hypothetical protein